MTFSTAQLIALLPIVVTAATAVLVMLSIAVSRNHWRSSVLTVGGLSLALVSVLLAAKQIPQTLTPLLIVDGFSCLYMLLILAATLACAILAFAYLEGFQGNRDEYYLLLVLSSLGAVTLACARHMAGLFIGLELLSIPLFGMVGYLFREKRSLEAAIKYMVLSAAASATLLFGMALLYAQTGTLMFTELADRLGQGAEWHPLVLIAVTLMLCGLAFKLSLVPFHLWTPDVYQGAPAPVAAYLATVSKTAVLAVLLRFYFEAPAAHAELLQHMLGAMAFASILVGNLLALLQSNIKRLLGYSSIAHFGYVLVAIVASNQLSVEAVGVYLITYLVTTIGAFGVVALMSSPYRHGEADALFDYRGLFWRRPYLAVVLTAMMLSLAGIPLTAGFIGKFYVVAAGVDSQLWWLLGALVVGSAIGLFYYLRVTVTLFLGPAIIHRHDAAEDWGQHGGGLMVIGITALMFFLGVYPQPALNLIQAAGIVLAG